jgi:predicted enzyme related to lactoylglutathione lyase
MSEEAAPEVGSVLWLDLTVEDAEAVRDFYSSVVGWGADAVSMGEYDDFNMTAPDSGLPCAGICHARGPNTDLPTQWMVYISVADLEASVERCRELGGEVVSGPKRMAGQGAFAVIRDPAGAVMALFEPAT